MTAPTIITLPTGRGMLPGRHGPVVAARRASEHRELIEAMLAAPAKGWHVVPGGGRAIRWDRQVPTPDWAREPAGWDWRSEIATPLWADPTCPQRVFITLATPSATPVLGLWRAPWAVRVDQPVTPARALAVLADPAATLDAPARQQHGTRQHGARQPNRTEARPAIPCANDRDHQSADPPYAVIGGIVYLSPPWR